jgi:hypothetical protein
MDVTVEIDLPARTNVLMVPNGALTFAPQGQRAGTNVYLLGSDNQPRQIPVAVEASDGKRPKWWQTAWNLAHRSSPVGAIHPASRAREAARAGNLDRAPRVTWMMRLMKKPTAPLSSPTFSRREAAGLMAALAGALATPERCWPPPPAVFRPEALLVGNLSAQAQAAARRPYAPRPVSRSAVPISTPMSA